MAELQQDLSESNMVFIHSDLDDMGLSMPAFRVYCHLARRTLNSRQDKWPGGDSMAQVCRANRDTVWRGLKELIERGMVVREKRKGTTSRHVLTKPSTWRKEGDSGKEGAAEKRGQGVAEKRGQGVAEKRGHEGTPVKYIHKVSLAAGSEEPAAVVGSAPAAREREFDEQSGANGVEKKRGLWVRERNLQFDALARLDGIGEGRRGTEREMGRVGKALMDIKAVCPELTVEEIESRAVKWQRLFPRGVITSAGLAANWNRCAWDELGLEKQELPEGCDWRAIVEGLGMEAPDEWEKVGEAQRELIVTEWRRITRTKV